MMNEAIITKKLTKQYPGTKTAALKNLSINIKRGEVYGFLGPNGAGKSTAIRTLLNFIQPTSGSATILGLDMVKDDVAIRQKIGYLSGDFRAYPKMTVRQFLRYMSELQPLKKRDYVNELTGLFKLNLNQKIGALSKGNRQKVGVIQALMHQPELLILDEPTDGLDPLMQEHFYGLIREFKQKGGTVFVSSHNLTEVQKMCDRIGFIREGKLVSEQSISELALEASQTFDITFAGNAPLTQLKKLAGGRVIASDKAHVSVHMHGNLSGLFAVLAKNPVKSLSTKELDLEDEFMRFYEDKKAKP